MVHGSLGEDLKRGVNAVAAESTLSLTKGGKFVLDLSSRCGGGSGSNGRATPGNATSPICSPRGSGDYGYGLWPYCMYRGFVMSASVEGEGRCSKPTVEVSVPHVNCTEDAAAFVALAAAVDLSVDACRLFSQRLRKELCQQMDLVGWFLCLCLFLFYIFNGVVDFEWVRHFTRTNKQQFTGMVEQWGFGFTCGFSLIFCLLFFVNYGKSRKAFL
jgi:hypothetical protein